MLPRRTPSNAEQAHFSHGFEFLLAGGRNTRCRNKNNRLDKNFLRFETYTSTGRLRGTSKLSSLAGCRSVLRVHTCGFDSPLGHDTRDL